MSKPAKPSMRDFVREQLRLDREVTADALLERWRVETKDPEASSRGKIQAEVTKYANILDFNIVDGLATFFDSQAKLLLAQYDNIQELLGPADADWTWTGEHCEELIREVLRRFLPPQLRVGKGYIFGRRVVSGNPRRSPEVDILVYDPTHFPPMFEMGNFVVARPESVRAVIQVKRTLTASTLRDAVSNIIAAKSHILECAALNGHSTTSKAFSAVIAYQIADEHDDDEQTETVAAPTIDLATAIPNCVKKHVSDRSDAIVLPDWVGTLKDGFSLFQGDNLHSLEYSFIASTQESRNVAVSVLLAAMIHKMGFLYGVPIPRIARSAVTTVAVWTSS